MTAQLCKRHYDRRRSMGDENAPVVYTRGWSLEEKLDHYREGADDPSACWDWSGSIGVGGYAIVWFGTRESGGRSHTASRVAYELANGPIPDGLEIDHMCHNWDLSCAGGETCLHRRCTNPHHLRAATRAENIQARRSEDRPASKHHNRGKTHCKRGHEFTEENTRHWRGGRYCRACQRLRQKERQLRLKQQKQRSS